MLANVPLTSTTGRGWAPDGVHGTFTPGGGADGSASEAKTPSASVLRTGKVDAAWAVGVNASAAVTSPATVSREARRMETPFSCASLRAHHQALPQRRACEAQGFAA